MNQSKARKEIAALRDAALEDLAKTSDSQLRKEAVEDGDDVTAIAAHMRSVMRDAAASVHRQRLAQARELMEARPIVSMARIVHPSLEQVKRIVEGVFAQDPALGIACREGKTQSDEDWLSLYDDLVTLGAINPTTDER